MRRVLILTALLLSGQAFAQGPQRLVSPEVHPDKSVTFRLRAPGAKEVFMARESAERLPMQKDDQGVWTVKTSPLEPDLYGYSFVVDGVTLTDPSSPILVKPNFIYPSSYVHVPGPASLPWEIKDIPRGVVHHHFYHSAVVGDDRDFYVYTPPGYDSKAARQYPTLYLLHGFSDDASGWTAVGRAHVILDSLIADGKAKPMLVVMPLGYGAPEVVSPRSGPRDNTAWRRNVEKFSEATLKEVVPQVEQLYRASQQRTDRAIAGLSMGGAEALATGLNAVDRFAWVGAFSSGGLGENFAGTFPTLDAKANDQLRLLWMACGTEDGLIQGNRKLVEWLKSKNIRHNWTETPGAHTWMVWRRYLAQFVPLLFQ